MGIGDLRDEAARQAGMIGGQRYPVLAVTAPKNDPREAALGNHLLTALGLRTRGRWSERKYRDCSRPPGFSQPGHDAVLPGCVAGLRRGLHATYPAPGAHGSARASAP